tara:strand:+ start:399 stop:1142 length:744 start_codon:yes stop_codon:yes gene_type:complete
MSNSKSQLDLFHGVLLTTEQEQEMATWIENQAKRAANNQENVNRIMLLLDEAGFVQDRDYKCNFEVYEVTSERDFGYSYNNTNYTHEVSYLNAVGGVYLIVNTIKDGKLEVFKTNVDRDGDKLMCTSITEQYRYYKPSSLYTKFNEHNDRKIEELEHTGKQKIALNIIVAKYQKLYPEAEVTICSDYYRRSYTSFPTVKVCFASGSYIVFTLGYGSKMEEEVFHKKHDAVSETTETLLERFNNQKAK